MTRENPDPIDIRVGTRLRQRREERDITQTVLGAVIGVSFQQIQKYEKAKDRISASRLYRAAQFLGIEINYFFDDLP